MNNFANNYFDYIGATGEYTISDYVEYTSNILNKRIDDIDIETSNISSNISSNYTEGLRNELWEVNPNNSKCLIKSIPDYNNNIHTYIINSNTYGEIRFKNIYTGDNIRVNIDKFGKLNVYHIYDLLKPTISEGWKDVESEITNLIILSQINGAEIIVVQGQIAGIDASINFILGELTTLNAYNRAINLNLETLSYGIFNNQAYQTLLTDTAMNLSGYYSSMINQFSAIAVSTRVSQFTTGILIPAGVAGVIGSIMYAYDMTNIHNLTSNALNCNVNLINTERRQILEASSNLIKDNYNSFNSNFCNMSLEQGFINSNITNQQFISSLNTNEIKINNTNVSNIFVASNVLSNINLNQGFINSNITNQQFINELKSNKVMLGAITTPNLAFQMEMTGDLNLNELYRNSVSLTSLLNQKQGNLTFNNPLLNTTNTITLKKDASLSIDGSGNLSVLKTATTPIVITGNDFSLNYDSSLTKISGSLSVVKTSSLPLSISASHNFSLNYDSTLTLSGNNLKVADAVASKWTTSSTNIYNNNTGNVGIGFSTPQQKLSINGIAEICNLNSTKLIFSYDTTNTCRHSILTSHNTGAETGNHIDFFLWRYGQSASVLGDRQLLRLAGTHTLFYGNRYFWINDKTIDSGNKNYTLTPLSVFNQTASSSSILNDPQPVLNLARQGASAQTYGQNACFKLCRWENSGLNSRTRLDIDLSDGVNDDTNIISLRSDGKVSFNTGNLYLATRIIQDHLFNNTGRAHSTYTNFNTPTDFGCHFIQGTTNSPNVNGAGQYYSMSLGLGSEYYNGSPSGNYKTQIAIPRNVGNPYLCVRYMENGGWGGWNKFASGVADNASSSTFSIRSPNESTNSILYLGTPFDANSASKCAIIAQGLGSYSRSKLHFCLNGTADNSSSYQASLVDGSFTFDYNGNMGLMNQSPPNIGGGDYSLHLGNSAMTTTSGNLIIHKRNNSGGTRLYRIGYDGYFWTTIGDSGNNNSLSSWIYQFSFPYNCPTNSCYLTGSGGMVIAGTLTQNSDQRIKCDIRTIDNSLWKLSQLRGVYYTHIIEQTKHIGLIAQEVEMVIPEVVIEGERNNLKGVSYGNLVALLIEGIKELKVINDRQQEIINNQEKKINDIYEILSRNGLS